VEVSSVVVLALNFAAIIHLHLINNKTLIAVMFLVIKIHTMQMCKMDLVDNRERVARNFVVISGDTFLFHITRAF
jgi:hypothetical protein